MVIKEHRSIRAAAQSQRVIVSAFQLASRLLAQAAITARACVNSELLKASINRPTLAYTGLKEHLHV